MDPPPANPKPWSNPPQKPTASKATCRAAPRRACLVGAEDLHRRDLLQGCEVRHDAALVRHLLELGDPSWVILGSVVNNQGLGLDMVMVMAQ